MTDRASTVAPETWSNWTSDPNCVAIVAAWGKIRKDEEPVRDRRKKVAQWLNGRPEVEFKKMEISLIPWIMEISHPPVL